MWKPESIVGNIHTSRSHSQPPQRSFRFDRKWASIPATHFQKSILQLSIFFLFLASSFLFPVSQVLTISLHLHISADLAVVASCHGNGRVQIPMRLWGFCVVLKLVTLDCFTIPIKFTQRFPDPYASGVSSQDSCRRLGRVHFTYGVTPQKHLRCESPCNLTDVYERRWRCLRDLMSFFLCLGSAFSIWCDLKSCASHHESKALFFAFCILVILKSYRF